MLNEPLKEAHADGKKVIKLLLRSSISATVKSEMAFKSCRLIIDEALKLQIISKLSMIAQ